MLAGCARSLLSVAARGAGALARVLGRPVWPLSVLALRKDAGEVALGAKAPAFDLASATGGRTSLADLVLGGRPVLVFYRGDW